MPPEGSKVQVALVTGAAGGIGRAVVQRLRGLAMRVVASDITLAALPCTDPDMLQENLDVTDEAAVAAVIARALSTFGRLDHVVHLAGRTGSGPIDAVSAEQWRELLEVNLTSALHLAKAAHGALRASRGTLTLMSSTNGLNGGNALSGPAYAVAKAGIINLTRYLAKEWAGEGIRVNCLAPGPIDTPMVARFPAEVRERLEASVPLGRLGRAPEIAAAIAYLTSAEAAFVTGTVHNLSGGLVID
jgi:NAD(P)-dependent dehydrogenase (short-subunit alcohol dehydrogenase family)